MWLYFNRNGQLITSLEHGNPARAGSTNFKIFAVFEDIDETNIDEFSATIKLIKPDLYSSSYPVLLMQQANAEFELITGEEEASDVLPFQNNHTYYGFLFDFSDFDYGAEEEYVLLDTQGKWNSIITVISTPIQGDVYNVQGVASFNVGGIGTPDPTDTSIYDVVTNQLVAEINKRVLQTQAILVMRFEDIDMNDYLEGQMFYASDRHKLYQIIGDDIVQIPFILNIEDGNGENALQQNGCIADGDNSFAVGFHTHTLEDFQTAVGKYNDNKSDTLFEVGNGTDNEHRSNAFEVYENGIVKANNQKLTSLCRHHFDIILQTTDLPTIPNGYHISINVNALSTSNTPWTTLSELDGGGFIVSAFGLINDSQGVPADFNHIFELKIFYSSLGNGTLLLNIHDLTDNTVKAVAITTVYGGQNPNTYQIEDSVTEL